MAEITELLRAARDGEPAKLAAVFEALYPELKKLASWRSASAAPHATMTTTVLVHETFVKMVRGRDLQLQDRRHFFACAARAMRQILVDHARFAAAGKRGGGAAPVNLPIELAAAAPVTQWLDLDRALDALEEIAPGQRELVELRYFAGLGRDEVAELLGCSTRTVERNWERARAFLHAQLASASS